jgi:hypothetical protein
VFSIECEINQHTDEACADSFAPIRFVADRHIDPADVEGIGVHGIHIRQVHLLQPAFADGYAIRFN